jgi:hypothetical protein
VGDFRCMVTDSTGCYSNVACRRMSGSTASSNWEKYHMAIEHMHIINLVLSNVITIVNFFKIFSGWKRILDT